MSGRSAAAASGGGRRPRAAYRAYQLLVSRGPDGVVRVRLWEWNAELSSYPIAHAETRFPSAPFPEHMDPGKALRIALDRVLPAD